VLMTLNGFEAYGMRSGNEKGSRVVMSSTLRDVR
jgi:hypothetical protein